MFRPEGEPRLGELLEDPILHLLIERDGISLAELRRVIAEARARVWPDGAPMNLRQPR